MCENAGDLSVPREVTGPGRLTSSTRGRPAGPVVAAGVVGTTRSRAVRTRVLLCDRSGRSRAGSRAGSPGSKRRPQAPSRPLAPLLWHDEDTLNVRGKPAYGSGSRNARDECDPGHADGLPAGESGDEREVRVPNRTRPARPRGLGRPARATPTRIPRHHASGPRRGLGPTARRTTRPPDAGPARAKTDLSVARATGVAGGS